MLRFKRHGAKLVWALARDEREEVQRLAAKVQERDTYHASLANAATFLSEHFRSRPECADLFRELEELERSSVVAEPPTAGPFAVPQV